MGKNDVEDTPDSRVQVALAEVTYDTILCPLQCCGDQSPLKQDRQP